jgi:hypothetical protein
MNFSGHDYLKNMVHLPFFLQNSGLRKVKLAQKSSQSHRKSVTNQMDECGLVHSVRKFYIKTVNYILLIIFLTIGFNSAVI